MLDIAQLYDHIPFPVSREKQGSREDFLEHLRQIQSAITSGLLAIVQALLLYPFKGGRGVSLENAILGEHGLEHPDFGVVDREFALVGRAARSDREGLPEFDTLNQKSIPELALIETDILADGTLVLSVQSMDIEPLRIPLDLEAYLSDRAPMETHIFKDRYLVADQGDAAAQWITRVVEESNRKAGIMRKYSELRIGRFDPKLNDGKIAALSDGGQILVTSAASLQLLNLVAQAIYGEEFKIPRDRFRTNIEIDIPIEDILRRAFIERTEQTIELLFGTLCPRCPVVDTDQKTGHFDNSQVRRPLEAYRPFRNGHSTLGVNVEAKDSGGVISLDDTLIPAELKAIAQIGT